MEKASLAPAPLRVCVYVKGKLAVCLCLCVGVQTNHYIINVELIALSARSNID